MDLSFFTRRYVDRSKNTGFQFEFFCDRCNKGHMTPFRIHALGVVTSLWDATDWKKEKEKDFDFDTLKKDVSKLFLKGKAWIEAYTNAVEEAQKYFKHCPRCLKWVCPKSCYNPKASLCQGCAPLTEAEKVQLKAEEKRKETSKPAPEPVDAPRTCPHCGKSNPVATFCADCGQKVVQDIFCPGCGCKWSTEKKMKFCPRCGEEMPQLAARPVKPTVVKSQSERSSEKVGDHFSESFAEISTQLNEYKKVAEEYKNLAEDILGLKPKKTDGVKPAQKDEQKPAQKPVQKAADRPAEKPVEKSERALESDEQEESILENEETASKSNASESKVKSSGRKVTKIAKTKKATGSRKKVAQSKTSSSSKTESKQKSSKPQSAKSQLMKAAKTKPKPKAKKKQKP